MSKNKTVFLPTFQIATFSTNTIILALVYPVIGISATDLGGPGTNLVSEVKSSNISLGTVTIAISGAGPNIGRINAVADDDVVLSLASPVFNTLKLLKQEKPTIWTQHHPCVRGQLQTLVKIHVLCTCVPCCLCKP